MPASAEMARAARSAEFLAKSGRPFLINPSVSVTCITTLSSSLSASSSPSSSSPPSDAALRISDLVALQGRARHSRVLLVRIHRDRDVARRRGM